MPPSPPRLRHLRRASATLVLGAAALLVGMTRSEPWAEAEAWRDRTKDTIDQLAGVGVETHRYRRHWRRGKTLIDRAMYGEAVRAFRDLAAVLEGWDAAPPAPRRPAEALTDPRAGPATRDPRAEERRVLKGPAGYGRWRGRSLRDKLTAAARGEYARPLSGERRMKLGHKIDHERLKDRARAAHSAAAARWSAWMEEADREGGVAAGVPTPRVGGGKVLARERPHDQDHPGQRGSDRSLPGSQGVGAYRGRPTRRVVQDVHEREVAPLRASGGVGAYGSPLRLARSRLGPWEDPGSDGADPGWSDPLAGPDPSPEFVKRPPPKATFDASAYEIGPPAGTVVGTVHVGEPFPDDGTRGSDYGLPDETVSAATSDADHDRDHDHGARDEHRDHPHGRGDHADRDHDHDHPAPPPEPRRDPPAAGSGAGGSRSPDPFGDPSAPFEGSDVPPPGAGNPPGEGRGEPGGDAPDDGLGDLGGGGLPDDGLGDLGGGGLPDDGLGDLGGGDLPDDGLGDLGGGDLPDDGLGDLGLDDDPAISPPRRPDGPARAVPLKDLGLRKGALAGSLVAVDAKLGPVERVVPPWARLLTGTDPEGRALVSLYDGAVEVTALVERGWVEDLAPDAPVRAEGLFLYDPDAPNPDQQRLLVADSIAPR